MNKQAGLALLICTADETLKVYMHIQHIRLLTIMTVRITLLQPPQSRSGYDSVKKAMLKDEDSLHLWTLNCLEVSDFVYLNVAQEHAKVTRVEPHPQPKTAANNIHTLSPTTFLTFWAYENVGNQAQAVLKCFLSAFLMYSTPLLRQKCFLSHNVFKCC